MNKAIIIGRGSSVLESEKGSLIDSFDLIIRVNHLPSPFLNQSIGSKTNILSCRAGIKIAGIELKDTCIWHCHPENTLSDAKALEGLRLLQKQNNEVIFISESEMTGLRDLFYKKSDPLISAPDKQYGFCIPDTGITTIWLALNRLKDYQIFVYGFDQYKNGNKSIHGEKNTSSIFNTPVLKQMIFYKMLLKTKKIYELSTDSICL